MCVTKISGIISLASLFLIGCGQTEAPVAVVVSPNPELVSQIDSTSIGDFMESKNGMLCQVRYKFNKDRELNCGDGVPLWGNAEYHARHFVRVIKKGEPEYKGLVTKFPVQYQ